MVASCRALPLLFHVSADGTLYGHRGKVVVCKLETYLLGLSPSVHQIQLRILSREVPC